MVPLACVVKEAGLTRPHIETGGGWSAGVCLSHPCPHLAFDLLSYVSWEPDALRVYLLGLPGWMTSVGSVNGNSVQKVKSGGIPCSLLLYSAVSLWLGVSMTAADTTPALHLALAYHLWSLLLCGKEGLWVPHCPLLLP